VLVDIAKKHNKTWAQVLVRWSLQKVTLQNASLLMEVDSSCRALFHCQKVSRRSASRRMLTSTISSSTVMICRNSNFQIPMRCVLGIRRCGKNRRESTVKCIICTTRMHRSTCHYYRISPCTAVCSTHPEDQAKLVTYNSEEHAVVNRCSTSHREYLGERCFILLDLLLLLLLLLLLHHSRAPKLPLITRPSHQDFDCSPKAPIG